MPNLFSPNGDGVNDIYYPRGSGLEKILSLRIFSRWGEMIFERLNFNSNNPASGWDGRFRGKDLPPDTFVYTMEIRCENGAVLPVNGNITLVR